MKNYEYDKEFYIKFRKLVVKTMDLLYKIDATGIENIPDDGNYILVGNHLHILDAGLIAKYDDSLLRFMVNNKLYEKPLDRYIFQKCGTIGIETNKMDIKAVRDALEVLKEYSMVIFPEGKTHKQEVYVPFKPGIAGISRISKTPVIPFGIVGTYKPFSNLKINFGTPLIPSKMKINKNEIDILIENEVRKLEKK